MKTKIVLWGENEKDEKILLGIELLDANNIIRIHNIPEKDATELFYNQMMNQWREGQKVSMPESTAVIDRPLSMTEGLLPDNIKTERQDILARAKTEWHFVILSSKLYESYADEVAQIKERVKDLTDFDQGMWEEMKSFWKKVQNQVQEKNLFREHATELRSKTNEIFDSLKSLKKSMNDEFEGLSKGHYDKFIAIVDDIEARIEKGLGLQPIFNELKGVQADFKNYKFTRKHQNDIWNRIDAAFKKVKEKKFGSKAAGGNNPVNRLTRRLEGLQSAIGKMEQSIGRDTRDKQFQIKRIDTTDGQLELQIRQAKMAMIEERINSKQVKLDDMLSTRVELEGKIASAQKKEEAREAKKTQAKAVKEAKKTIKEDIAKDITERSEGLKEKEDKLKKAAESIKEAKSKKKKPGAPAIIAAVVAVPIVAEVVAEAQKEEVVVSDKADIKEDVGTPAESNVEAVVKTPEPSVEVVEAAIEEKTAEVKEDVATPTESIVEAVVKTPEPPVEVVEAAVAEKTAEVKEDVVKGNVEAVVKTPEPTVEVVEAAIAEKTVEVKEDIATPTESIVEAVVKTPEPSVEVVEAAIEEKTAEVKEDIATPTESVVEAVVKTPEPSVEVVEAAVAEKTAEVKEDIATPTESILEAVVKAPEPTVEVVEAAIEEKTTEVKEEVQVAEVKPTEEIGEVHKEVTEDITAIAEEEE